VTFLFSLVNGQTMGTNYWSIFSAGAVTTSYENEVISPAAAFTVPSALTTMDSNVFMVFIPIIASHPNPGDLTLILCDPSYNCVFPWYGNVYNAPTNFLAGPLIYDNTGIDDGCSSGWNTGQAFTAYGLAYNRNSAWNNWNNGRSCVADPMSILFTQTLASPINQAWRVLIVDYYGSGYTFNGWELRFYQGCLGANCGNGHCTAIGWGQGQYTCTCNAGWTGSLCTTETNYCSSSPCPANTACANTGTGSYTCTCNTGYQMISGSCADCNECTGQCGLSNDCNTVNGTCTNTLGSYTCACKTGYQGNGIACTDCNECAGQCGGYTCQANSACVNTLGSYACDCNSGFQLNGNSCVDINECSAGTDNCNSTTSVCQNTIGSYSCICLNGTSSPSCITDDFCGSGNNNCSAFALCTNSASSFFCTCRIGFSGSGTTCSDVDECTGGGNGTDCDANASCTNTIGSYFCTCNVGFYGIGAQCTQYNQCLGENGGNNCSVQASCTNLVNSFSCSCLPGYFGNGISCTQGALPQATPASFGLVLTWNSPVGASSYQVVVVVFSSGSTVFNVDNITGTSIAVADLDPFTAYNISLTTFASGGYSCNQTIQVTTLVAPSSGMTLSSQPAAGTAFDLNFFLGCPFGTYQEPSGQCISCPANSGSPAGANSSSQCTCLTGYTLVSGQCQGLNLLNLCVVFHLSTVSLRQLLSSYSLPCKLF